MATDAVEEGLAKEVTRFLDEVVGKEKLSAAKVYSVLQDSLNRQQRLENEVCTVVLNQSFVVHIYIDVQIKDTRIEAYIISLHAPNQAGRQASIFNIT